MFTIMENRKRPRLELINTNNNNSSNEIVQGVASAVATTTTTNNAMGTATLATIGGQSFILSNSTASGLPANILLSICDDNSDESEEYIIDHTGIVTSPIKQEHSVSTQTINQQNQHQNSLLHTSVPQYRIINQPTKSLNTSNLNNSSLVTSSTANNSNSLLTNSVHLPAGCEIYVIKEVLDSPKQILAADSSSSSSTTTKSTINCNNSIKLEPMSPLPLIRHNTTTTTLNSQNSLSLNASNCLSNNTSVTAINNNSSSSSCATSPDDSAKRSLILEAYKKRDDKRRATHNEVERRRRDKINSWIFKLKEMLPSEITPNGGVMQKDLNQNSLLNSTRLLVQQGVQSSTTTTRTPPSDSKSQILIKACEYIKSMQEEIKSLRECLTENENLRLSNQRLQEEINNLRNKQTKLHNNNNILITNNNSHNQLTNNNNNHHQSHIVNDDDEDVDNTDECEITLNSLNATYANVQLFSPIPNANTTTTTITNQNHNNHQHHHTLAGLVGGNVTTTGTITPTVNVTYAKRELIITDYVD